MRERKSAGYSLIELLIVVGIIALVGAFALAQLKPKSDAEQVASAVSRRIQERRSAAMKLSPQMAQTTISYYLPPVVIDFADLTTTRSLLLPETVEIDCSHTPQATCVTPPATDGGVGVWTYQYQGQALNLPSGWRVAASQSDLSPIPGLRLGELTTAVGFDRQGRPDPRPSQDSLSETGTIESPFWAIYLTNGTEARAIAIHSTGFVEPLRYDAGQWTGYGGRLIP